MKKFILFGVIATSLMTSCEKDVEKEKDGILIGPTVQVHTGKAWTWVKNNASGNPERVGITLTNAVLNSVPVGDQGHGGAHGHESMWNLQFHSKARISPFDHVNVGWNAMGHEPEMFYGKPHFDFHFYMMKPSEVANIPPYEVDSSKFKNWPAPDYFPPTYINPGGGVPQMGAHWVDVTSGEFNGQGFTETFIFGSYDGKVNFYEPMITLEFLKNTSNFERAIPQPQKYQENGYYPTKMKIEKHNDETQIILEGFQYRTAS